MSNLTLGSSCSMKDMAVRVCSVSSPHSMLLCAWARDMKVVSWSCILQAQCTNASSTLWHSTLSGETQYATCAHALQVLPQPLLKAARQ
jgi:hypothetical protein